MLSFSLQLSNLAGHPRVACFFAIGTEILTTHKKE